MECTLRKFADDTQLCGAVAIGAIQKDLDRLQRWPPEDFMKFIRAKGKVLHLGLDSPKCQWGLGREWAESSSEEKDLDVLVDKNLNMTQL
ncbi:hypothetical protein DUI87_08016 [Hirundo rustica rustica]|uniref:Rna-directed dna polymerase from mobile element jockey-like n=1 Tax=Hirundo rustica rustica TaxID=333673 RepID=A0A3M0KR97_HIRRU|nr:hypothetical protein DUI87_08016 [Hirundo rustica rustica]